jgi:hypothetical protein
VACRVAAVGLPAGPYTPAQYKLIAPPTALSTSQHRFHNDPDVTAATAARDAAREAFDAVNEVWLSAVVAHRSAELASHDPYERDVNGDVIGVRKQRGNRRRVVDLAEREKSARDLRDAAWAKVVKANDAILKAQTRNRFIASRGPGY